MDAVQWMGAVRMRVQTADKNITIIHTTPVHQITSGEDKSCVFVRYKSIKKNVSLSCYFQLKYNSIIHNNSSSSVKVVLPESRETSAQIKQRLQVKIKIKIVLNKWSLDSGVRDNRRWTFSLEEALLWTTDSYFGQKQQFYVKTS